MKFHQNSSPFVCQRQQRRCLNRCEALSHDNPAHSERRRRVYKMAAEVDVMRLMTGLFVFLISASMISATCGPLGFEARDLLKLVCFVLCDKSYRRSAYKLSCWMPAKKSCPTVKMLALLQGSGEANMSIVTVSIWLSCCIDQLNGRVWLHSVIRMKCQSLK